MEWVLYTYGEDDVVEIGNRKWRLQVVCDDMEKHPIGIRSIGVNVNLGFAGTVRNLN